jgi:hypothetical protein
MSIADTAMDHDDSPWMSDEEEADSQVASTSSTAPSQISQQEWDKLASRYSDVRTVFLSL